MPIATPAARTLRGVPLGELRLGAPLGSGAGGVVWSATTPAGDAVALRLLPELDPVRHGARRRRLDVLRALDHPGHARILTPPPGGDDRLLVSELVGGPSLATVRTGRLGLTAAEAIGLAHDLADALAALHALGVVHGDVAPANVLVRTDPDGGTRPVLVDLLGDLGWESGTTGFVAPEVRAGGVAGAAADVWALATLAVWSAQVGERGTVAAALTAALADDPRARPDAARLVAALASAPRAEVRVPPPSVLAGASLREQAQRAPTVVRAGRRRRPRHRRVSRWRRAVPIAVVLVVLTGALLVWGGAAGPAPTAPASGTVAPVSSASDPQALLARVVELIALRDAALMAGDEAALSSLTVPGSPARQQDLALLAALHADDAAVTGLRTTPSDPRLIKAAPGSATVQVVLEQAAHERSDGTTTRTVPAVPPRCVELGLRLREGSWRVATTSACPEAGDQ